MKYLTTNELAELLRTNPTVIRKSRQTGVLFDRPAPPHIRLTPRKILYEADAIAAWLQQAPKAIKTY